MIIAALMWSILSIVAFIFAWLPDVEVLPFGIDSYMLTFSGVIHSLGSLSFIFSDLITIGTLYFSALGMLFMVHWSWKLLKLIRG